MLSLRRFVDTRTNYLVEILTPRVGPKPLVVSRLFPPGGASWGGLVLRSLRANIALIKHNAEAESQSKGSGGTWNLQSSCGCGSRL